MCECRPLSVASLLPHLSFRQAGGGGGREGGGGEGGGGGGGEMGRIFATGYAGIGTICEGSNLDVDGLPCALLPGYSVKASFFAASRSTAAWLADRYTTVTARALAAGYLLTEEYYLAMVVREEPHRFSLLDRSENPLFEDDHCMPHSLLQPPEVNPKP